MTILPQDRIADVPETDILVVPNVLVNSGAALRALDRRLLGWIRNQYGSGVDLYSACGGPLVLAEAGLLDGFEATMHWAYVDLFRREYPAKLFPYQWHREGQLPYACMMKDVRHDYARVRDRPGRGRTAF